MWYRAFMPVAAKKPKPKKAEPTSIERERFEKRKRAVEAVRRGEPATTVGRVMGFSVRSLFAWLAAYRNAGEDGLREKKRSGRPRKVDADLMRWLYDAIAMGNPRQYKFEFCLWTLGIVRTMLKKEKGIELSKSGVCRLLAHLGLSPQRPTYQSIKRDAAEHREYLRKRFPELRRLAKETGAVIYFLDEASVRSDSHRGTTWAPIGETPIVEDSGRRFGVRMISAVSPRGDMKFRTFEGMMNGPKFVGFLKELRRDAGRPIIVIADNASYHRGPSVRQYVESSGGEVVIDYLPRYSPELNPDEQVWNHSKARLAKLFIATREEMLREVRAVLRSIQASPDLVRSFFGLAGTQYAADVGS